MMMYRSKSFSNCGDLEVCIQLHRFAPLFQKLVRHGQTICSIDGNQGDPPVITRPMTHKAAPVSPDIKLS